MDPIIALSMSPCGRACSASSIETRGTGSQNRCFAQRCCMSFSPWTICTRPAIWCTQARYWLPQQAVPAALIYRPPDIKASNILSKIEDESILRAFEAAEAENPSPQKVTSDRTIYASRKLGLPKSYGPPVLCDFGEARCGEDENNADIQPEVYRAPEVILQMPWSYPVDIWNVGVMARLPSRPAQQCA